MESEPILCLTFATKVIIGAWISVRRSRYMQCVLYLQLKHKKTSKLFIRSETFSRGSTPSCNCSFFAVQMHFPFYFALNVSSPCVCFTQTFLSLQYSTLTSGTLDLRPAATWARWSINRSNSDRCKSQDSRSSYLNFLLPKVWTSIQSPSPWLFDNTLNNGSCWLNGSIWSERSHVHPVISSFHYQLFVLPEHRIASISPTFLLVHAVDVIDSQGSLSHKQLPY